MLIRRKRGWEIPESAVTSRDVYFDRRRFLRGVGAGILGLSASGLSLGASGEGESDILSALTGSYYPASLNETYMVERPLTEKEDALGYNNYYEFGSHKYIQELAQKLSTHPWRVVIDGLVDNPRDFDFTDLLALMPLEQRIYRHRCVEAWAMTVPWDGFALRELVRLASPSAGAKYLRMETYADASVMLGLRQGWYPWPYVEGLTLAEASHDLSFIATGMYGEPISKQNGAPLRLAVPWKYGFKSLKAISRFTFTSERPVGFWEELQGTEYGFWANVNPEVSHPRWSQARERLLGEDRKVATRLYNGYGEFVSDLYSGMDTNSRELYF